MHIKQVGLNILAQKSYMKISHSNYTTRLQAHFEIHIHRPI